MTVVSIAVTGAGRAMARRLPWELTDGPLGDAVRQHWSRVDGLVVFAAAGAAIRVIAPLLGDKTSDPAVVCVDEAGRWVVPLAGGHQRGANDLARQVAGLLGATAVVTTATDATGVPPLDDLPGLASPRGDVAAVTRALLDGERVGIDNPLGWPLPTGLEARLTSGRQSPCIVVTDHDVAPTPGTVVLHPPSLVVGVGASSGAPAADLVGLASSALDQAHLALASVSEIVTLDRKVGEPAIVALAASWNVPVRGLPAGALAEVAVPNPSPVVEAAVGTASVCEAAALLGAGPGASLLVGKVRTPTSTVAIARRVRPAGHLSVVGLGPGGPAHRTPAATAAVRHAEVVIGYGPYVDQAADALGPAADVIRSPIGEEEKRATMALEAAAAGRRVALVCSGDAGVYAMASLVYELAAAHSGVDVSVLPGVTAAVASAAVLGAPLGHDHVSISLSDLLTPWEVIEGRLRAAADADLVVCLYNPRSTQRTWQLDAAHAILARRRPPTTPVGIVTDAGRHTQCNLLTTIADFDPASVGMTTCVIVGSSTTRVVGGRMVTPRGYGVAP